MRDAIEEFLVVLDYSKRARLCLLLGVVFFFGITLVGDYLASRIEFQGVFASIADVVREKIIHRYDKVAWISLVSFLLLAVKSYRKDRKRLLQL